MGKFLNYIVESTAQPVKTNVLWIKNGIPFYYNKKWKPLFGAGSGGGNYVPLIEGEGANSIVLDYSNNIASNINSIALGYNTTSLNFAETAFGQYNISTKSDSLKNATLFSIGNGTEKEKSNAFEVKYNGDVYVKGIDVPIQNYFKTLADGDYSIISKIENVEEYLNAGINDLNDKVITNTSAITQTAEQITSEVSRVEEYFNGKISETNSTITQTADSILLEVGNNYTTLKGDIQRTESKIEQTSESIALEVESVQKKLQNQINTNKTSILQSSREIDLLARSTETINQKTIQNEANIAINSNSINSKVSQEVFNSYGNSVAEQFTEVNQTIEGIDTTVQSVTGEITTIRQDINGLTVKSNALEADVESLKKQSDGAIDTHFGTEIPTLNNIPAVNWTTSEEKNDHVGDLYYNNISGEAFRFSYNPDDNSYFWVMLSDSALTDALNNIAALQEAVDGKVTIFYTEPKNYKYGDVWFVHRDYTYYKEGSIVTSTNIGQDVIKESFSEADWVDKTKYASTKEVETELTNLNTYIEGSFKDGVLTETEIQQIKEFKKSFELKQSELKESYTILYLSSVALDEDKTALKTAFENLESYYTNLIAAIDGLTINTIEAYDTAYKQYLTSLKNYSKVQSEFTNSIQSELSKANDYIADISADNIITPIEKKQLIEIWRSISEEFATNKNIAVNYKIIDSSGNKRTDIYDTDTYYTTYIAYKNSYDAVSVLFSGNTFGLNDVTVSTTLSSGNTITKANEKLEAYYYNLKNFSSLISKITIDITDKHEEAIKIANELQDQLSPTDEITTIGKGVVLSSVIGVQSEGILEAVLNASDNVSEASNDKHGKIVFASGIAGSDDWNTASTVIYEDGHIKMNSGEIGDRVSIGNAIIGSFVEGESSLNIVNIINKKGEKIPLFTVDVDEEDNVLAVGTPYNLYTNRNFIARGYAAGTTATTDGGGGGIINKESIISALQYTPVNPADLGALAYLDGLSYSDVGVTKDVVTSLIGPATYAPYNASGYLPLSGGTMNENATIHWGANNTEDYTTFQSGFRLLQYNTAASQYRGGIHVGTYYGWQMTRTNQVNVLQFRGYDRDNARWSDWKTIAFTDSDITGKSGGIIGQHSTTSAVPSMSTGELSYIYNIHKGINGVFDSNSNANSLLTVSRHSGGYLSQLGFSGNGNLYYRSVNAGEDLVSRSWKTIAFTDSNVASAQALKHSNGTVGATVDASGGICLSTRGILSADGGLSLFEFNAGGLNVGYSMRNSYITSIYGNTIRFLVGDAPKMLINSSGNVTIGTADYASLYEGCKMYIDGNTTIGIQTSAFGTGPKLFFDATGRGHVAMINSVYEKVDWNASNKAAGSLVFSTFNHDTINTAMIINSSGNVTIGGSDLAGTSTKLYVGGATRIISNVIIGSSSLENGRLKIVGADTSSLTPALYVMSASGIPILDVRNGGNVLIGTTEDNGAKLQVNGGISTYHASSYFASYGSSYATSISELHYVTAIGAGKDAWNIYMWSFGNGNGCIQSCSSNATTTYGLLLQPFGGNVIIGTNQDNGAKLQVNGGISIASGYTLKIGDATISYVNGVLKVDKPFMSKGYVAGATASVSSGEGGVILNKDSVIEALGYTPYDSANPNGYITTSALSGYQLSSGLGSLAYKNGLTASEVGALSTSGGTISGAFGALTIKRHSEHASGIKYENNNGVLGYLGFNGSEPYFWGENLSNAKALIHSGNVGEYALPLKGGTINGDLSVRNFQYINSDGTVLSRLVPDGNNPSRLYHAVGAEWNIILHSGNVGDYALKIDGSNKMSKGVLFSDRTLTEALTRGTGIEMFKISAGGSASPTGSVYFSTLHAVSSYAGLQLAVFGGGNDNNLYYRKIGEDNTWSAWKTIAFTDSNVASADNAALLGGLGKTDFYRGNMETIPSAGNLAALDVGCYWVYENLGETYPVPSTYSSLVAFGKSYYSPQMCVRHDASKAWLRGIYGEGKASDWHELAFTDSTVAAANKLVTSAGADALLVDNNKHIYTSGYLYSDISGASVSVLDYMSDGSLLLGYGIAVAGLETQIHGKTIKLRGGTSRTIGFVLNESGNVTIGDSDLAGTSTKLFVDGWITTKYGYRTYDSGDYGIWNGGQYSGSLTSTDIAYHATKHVFYTGKVLIGTYTDNGAKLQVAGNFTCSHETRSNIFFFTTNGEDKGWFGSPNNLDASDFVASVYDGNIRFYTNNSERMRITSLGNVGIGTTNPQYKLDVAGTAKATQYKSVYSSTQWTFGGGVLTDIDTDFALTNSTTYQPYIVVKSNPLCVGIGIKNPAYTLEVGGTGRFSGAVTVGGSATFNGNVGIGTTAPQYKLDVAGNVGITNGYIDLANGHVKGNATLTIGVIGTLCARIQTSHYSTGYTCPLTINPNGGNVLIGTLTDNGARLQVNGNISTTTSIKIGDATLTWDDTNKVLKCDKPIMTTGYIAGATATAN